MKTIQYKTRDKSSWGKGPWQNEPDKIQWQDKKTGFPCLAVRGPSGAWCGYVGVPPGHKYYGAPYNTADEIRVHGGLTFDGFCQPGPEEKTVCHKPDEGEEDKVWWLGFDCAHSGDYMPASEYTFSRLGTYRDLDYVTKEVSSLAEQLL